jgi:hypothetical protein
MMNRTTQMTVKHLITNNIPRSYKLMAEVASTSSCIAEQVFVAYYGFVCRDE